MNTKPTCAHREAVFECEPEMWVPKEGGSVAYMLEIKATCETCGEPFLFVDLPISDDDHAGFPCVSSDGATLRVPMAPRDQCSVENNQVN